MAEFKMAAGVLYSGNFMLLNDFLDILIFYVIQNYVKV